MDTNTLSTPPKPTVDVIRRYVRALPPATETLLLDERAAQAARSVLGQVDSMWEQRMQAQVDTITKEVAAYLDQSDTERYIITSTELRGIVARSISRATGQIAVDVGRALTETATPSTQFSSALARTGDVKDTAGDYEQPNLLQEY